MSPPFDPYREWLGIATTQRPLTYFQLLGVSDADLKADVISNAAESQLAKLGRHLTGPQSRLAKRLLIELESAKNCLLDSALRDRYLQAIGSRGATLSLARSKSSPDLKPKTDAAPKNPLALDVDASLLSELLDEAPSAPKIVEPEAATRSLNEVPHSRWEEESSEDSGAGWPAWGLYVVLGAVSLVVGGLIYESLPWWENEAIVEEQPTVPDASAQPVSVAIALPQNTNPPIQSPVAPIQSISSEPQQKPVIQALPAAAVPVFAGLPECVDLPVLNRLTVGHDEALFELRPPAGIECKLSLTNPERKPDDKTRFELHPLDEGADIQSWQIDLVTSINSKSELNANVKETRAAIARLMWGDAFQFHWLRGAEDLPGDGLRSCGLEIEANGQQHFVSLRSPQKIEPLVVDLDQAFKPLPILGLGLPDTDLWRLELSRVEGPSMPGSSSATEAKSAKGTRGSLRVPIGAPELGAEIVLKLAELRGQTVLRMTVQYQDIDNKSIPLTNERIATLQRTLPREFEEARAKLNAVNSRQVACVNQLQQAQNFLSRDASNEQARVIAIECQSQLEHLAGQEKSLMKRLPLMQKRIGRFSALAEACGVVHQHVRLHVRVTCPAGTHRLEFMTTE